MTLFSFQKGDYLIEGCGIGVEAGVGVGGIDRFAWSLSRSWSRQNFADSYSDLKLQDTTRQQ